MRRESHYAFLSLVLALCSVQFLPVLHVNASQSHQKLTPRHVDDLQEKEDGCLDSYNYKHPHPCTPSKDCTFVVQWKMVEEDQGETEERSLNWKSEELSSSQGEGEATGKEGGWAEFHLITAIPSGLDSSSLWTALGFSPNSKMGNTDVITCWSEGGNFSVHDGYNKPDDHVFVMDPTNQDDPEQLRLVSAEIKDGLFHCTFQRKIHTGDQLQDKDLSSKQFVLLATGALGKGGSGGGGGNIMMMHTTRSASECACEVTLCSKACQCPGGFLYQLLKLHGIVMSICFMFLLPTGSIISRYYKAIFPNSWFKAHVTTMIIGVLWSLVGFGLVLAHTGGIFSVGPHQILGIICLSLCVLQPIIALFRPGNKPTKLTVQRRVFNIVHRSTALSILVLSMVVLFLGINIFHNSVVYYMFAVLSLSVIVNIVYVIFQEFLKWKQKTSINPPVGYHKVTHRDELSESEEEVYVKDDPAKCKKPAHKFEKGLLLLFGVQALVFALVISLFIFYFDAD